MENQLYQTRKDFLKQSMTGFLAIAVGFSSKAAIPELLKAGPKRRDIDKKIFSITAKEFREGVMPRAQLSKAASEIALTRATNKSVRQFAEWELMEAKIVIKVLQDGGTKSAPLSSDASTFLNKLKILDGKQFDSQYMRAELSNHEVLRDLAKTFIDGYDEQTTGKQEIGHVSNLALFAFTEHVGLCKEILAEIGT